MSTSFSLVAWRLERDYYSDDFSFVLWDFKRGDLFGGSFENGFSFEDGFTF